MEEEFMKMVKGNYQEGGGVYLGFYANGEFYEDVTINIPPWTRGNYIAFNHNLPKEWVEGMIGYLTEGLVNEVYSGFVKFGIYRLKDGILDTITPLEELEG